MNEKLKFRLPTAEDAAEYISYRQAFLDAGSSMDGTGPMRRTPDPMEWPVSYTHLTLPTILLV